ncbi:MFS transporter arabinose efflux permease [Amycolatopsis mediterranei S699]|uniref:MFS transporter, arabinose efflux permease n=2 Tax=Amycolatopsis mediterranei TaxID=33910 RepID=A0A0H3CZD1_AMYMU|nr:MFS transporter [Amycolatopsis mediterranei]ADJ42641.1 MFS transporter, arabinose efflux permease [Amycolatopsis mediterranei U32]AEK39331.1 MFS transporter arabinose efflux permease [Amycolatopsis mediterranei S699]AFO74355.1 MFS transporter arabinose efflux permease [Amycolatopsis mediterranei S699]AGT81484.1 MFS transporter arabinose efflux permease [Amycolatopsis mediterranei RB]KDO10059.1 MFS transporter [Amycolatopsis mediterranei]
MPVALLALAIGAFGIGTTEFVMMGVLPQAAADFGVDIPTAGHLISAYALGVVVGAPLLTAVAVRLPRKTMLLAMMGLFTVGNALFALSPNQQFGVAFRFLAGLPHGAFFGAGAVVASSLVGQGERAKAVSMMFLGLTLANVIGVPLGTLLGQQVGWRATFGVVAVIGLLAIAAIAKLVPHQGKPTAEASLKNEIGAFKRPQVHLALAIVTFGLGGVFACLSYITPMLTDVAGYSPSNVTLLLSLAGVGMTIGNLLGGRLADRALMPSLYIALLALASVLGIFTITAQGKIGAAITIFFVGVAGFMIGPMMQARIMEKAGGTPSLVSAAVQSAFNIANSIGAYLGGLVIAGGLGLVAPNWVGALLAVFGLTLAIVSGTMDRREARAERRELALAS